MPSKMISNQRGMTLIEVVIVIAIIATLAAVAVPSIITTLDLKDREATMNKMSNLETALNNYYEDVGEYPSYYDLSDEARGYVTEKGWSSIDFLVHNPYPATSSKMKDTIMHSRWNGPYIVSSFSTQDYKKDAWGRDIFYCPLYGRSKAESPDGKGYAGAADLPANAVMLASQGKTPGWGFRSPEGSYTGGQTMAMVNWRELTEFIPYSELFGGKYKHLLDDNVIKVVSPAQLDRQKTQETINKFEQIKSALCGAPPEDIESGGCINGFAADVGVVIPEGGAPETAKPIPALDTAYFRDFTNPLQLLLNRFTSTDAKDLYYGSPRDSVPPYRMGGPEAFNVMKSDLGYSWMGWRGPYIDEAGQAYINEQDPDVITFDCFIDGWSNPLQVYAEGEDLDLYDDVFDMNFGNRDEDKDYYGQYCGLMVSRGPNRIFDRLTGTAFDPNFVRPGAGVGEAYPSEGRDDDDIFVAIYKRDLWANIAPDTVIEAMEGEAPAVNTPVEITLRYQTGKVPNPPDTIYGIAVIYPDPSQAPGFNVVELMGSSTPIAVSQDPQYIFKNSFTAVTTNLFIPVGYCFFYVMVAHHQDVGNQPVGFCKALAQRLGWKETDWNGVTITRVYGQRVCVRNGISTISVRFTLLGGG